MKFSHLHVHTQYSLLDGAASIESLYKKAAKDNMPAVAITDHGNMFGAFEFVNQAWKNTKVVGKDANGKDIMEPVVKPVVGCEFYVVADRSIKSFSKEVKDKRYHQVLLAKNKIGYQNLIKLTSLGYIEGLYGKYPRIDKELIEKYHEGLIATTCCIGAYVPQTILREGEEKGEIEFKWWLDMFGEDYYIELQRHSIKEQDIINQTLQKFAKKYNVPVIATNDSHYTERDDYNAHDILLCINTGEKQATPGMDDFVNDENRAKNGRFKFPNDQFYFKTGEEMTQLFSDVPESIDNTNAIVDKIEVLNLKKDILLPAFPVPKEFKIHKDDTLNQWEYLRHITYEGAKHRYSEITPEIQERIDFELFTVKTMGFAGYFLIVSDFIKAGREMKVFVGPGRGSAAGSVVAFCIGITNIDPIKYKLLFERFLNPDRKSMPDIDTDFDDEGRQKVIDYVVNKYGKEQVAQIITYGTMAAKSSIKDVARVMDLPLPESNALAKLVPDKVGTVLKSCLQDKLTNEGLIQIKKGKEELFTLDQSDIENVKQLREIYKGKDIRAQILHEAERLEGSVRNSGIHAAGIIIAPRDLTELIPVSIAKDSPLWVTQIEGSVIEEAGVIKMDFLGLRTLSILKNALLLIKQNHGVDIDLDNLPLNDEKTFHLYQRGETNGTFQFESVGMQKYLRELKPDKFEDLIAMNALYRPGPMLYIPSYVARKHGREKVVYDLPVMQEYLEETYGITVYQEQVMLLSQTLAGFSKGDADVLRKAMGKKQKDVLDKMKAKFIEGATAKGHPANTLEKIWTDWEAFAQYAFNKSHSTCYALVAFQTAYLKAHYPSEYMAAVLNNAGNIEKVTFFMDECRRMGLNVLGPDINESDFNFSVNQKGQVRFGLGAVKGLGEAAVKAILEERINGTYGNIFDITRRVNARSLNKKSLEAMVYAGAFDCFEGAHRAQYVHVSDSSSDTSIIEKAIKSANAATLQPAMSSLFDDAPAAGGGSLASIPFPKVEPWGNVKKLRHEKEVTGMYFSGHPLDEFRLEIKSFCTCTIKDIEDHKNMDVNIAGVVIDVAHRQSKNGKPYGSFEVEDRTGSKRLTLFGENYLRFKHFLEAGQMLYIRGKYVQSRFYEDQFELNINGVSLLQDIRNEMTKKITLRMNVNSINDETISQLMAVITQYPGKMPLSFTINDIEDVSIGLSSRNLLVSHNNEFFKAIESNPEIELVLN